VPDPSVSIGRVVTGAIEGKFEHGYLVSIIMGTEKLRGVLYHLPSGHRGLQHASVHNLPGTLGAELQIPSREIPTVQSSGRKRRKRKKDPKAPRSHRSGYNFFFVEQHMKLKTFYRDRERELSRLIGAAWNRLTDEEKSVSKKCFLDPNCPWYLFSSFVRCKGAFFSAHSVRYAQGYYFLKENILNAMSGVVISSGSKGSIRNGECLCRDDSLSRSDTYLNK
jgi:hypothetical protein